MDQLKFYLKRGLWKLAEELQHTSGPVNHSVQSEIKVYLWNIAKSSLVLPHKLSSLTPIVISDSLQSWLAASILSKLPSSSAENVALRPKEVDAVKKEAEFKFILGSLLDVKTDSSVFEELCQLYSQVLRADRVKNPHEHLSSAAHSFLRSTFLREPLRTNPVVQKLLCLWCLAFQGTDNELQNVYKEVLWQCLQDIEDSHDPAAATTTLLCAVSTLQVSEEKNESIVEWLCTRVVGLFETEQLSRPLTYLAFASRERPLWLRMLAAAEDERYDRNAEEGEEDVATLERICGRLVDADGNVDVEEAFRRTTKSGRHFVEDVATICSQLLASGDKEIVRDCMSHPLLSNLWPVIMMYTWSQYNEREDIFSTLDWLIGECKKVHDLDPALSRLCTALSRHITVLEWCLRNRTDRHASRAELLRVAHEHSTLDTIRRTTSLAHVSWQEVRHILQHAHPADASGDQQGCPTVQWDVVTLDAFCVMMAAFQAITAAVELQTVYLALTKYVECSRKSTIPTFMLRRFPKGILQHPTADSGNNINSDLRHIEATYVETVANKLDHIKHLVCSLFPLRYRVEILENLFSLLFLRYEDCHEDSMSDSAGEEDDGERDKVYSPEVGESTVETIEDCDIRAEVRFQDRAIPELPDVLPRTQEDFSRPMSMAVGQSSPDLSSNRQLPTHDGRHPLLPTGRFCKRGSFGDSQCGGATPPATLRPPISSTPASSRGGGSYRVDSGGYVCNEYVVRDLLACLRDCLVETAAANYSSLSQDKGDMDVFNQAAPTPDSVQQRINRLTQCVSEAAWRLELLTEPNFMTQVGRLAAAESRRLAAQPRTEWMYRERDETDSDSDEEKKNSAAETTGRKYYKRNKSETEKSSESGNTTGGGSGVSGTSHRRRRSSNLKSRESPPLTVPTSTVNLMLSPPSSLAVQCLVCADMDKADQVIQMCGLEGSQLDVEVQFTQAYRSLQQTLTAKSAESSRVSKQPQQSQQKQPATTSSLFQAVKVAALAGVQATAFTGPVERFVSQNTLPSFPEPAAVTPDNPQAASMLQDSGNSAGMCVLDLAFTVGTSSEHSGLLLDVASKLCPSLRDEAPAAAGHRRAKRTVGVVAFTRAMIALLVETNNGDRAERLAALPRRVSLGRALAADVEPLDARACGEAAAHWTLMGETCAEFAASLRAEERVCGELRARGIATPTKNIHNKLVHVVFRKLIKVGSNGPQWKASANQRRTKKGETSEPTSSYLQHLYDYLKLLTALVGQNLPANKGFLCPGTYFEVMEDSLKALIGRLVFECSVPASRLEPIASRLRLDLVYNVVRNCCPRIPAAAAAVSCGSAAVSCGSAAGGKRSAMEWGRITLNQGRETHQDSSGPTKHPEVFVRCLLSDLLETLRLHSATSVGQSESSLLSADPSLAAILSETAQLAYLDLTLLSAGAETLAFCANLANLLWLHCRLRLPGPAAHRLASANTTERCVAMQAAGYNVGRLGFVSLADLQRHLLGDSCDATEHGFEGSEERLRRALPPVTRDPRLLFMLTGGTGSSPRVRVLLPEELDSQLDSCLTEYLNCAVRLEGDRLRIPERLSRYKSCVEGGVGDGCVRVAAGESEGTGEADGGDERDGTRNEVSLFEFVHECCTGDLHQQLSRCAETAVDLAVSVYKRETDFTITLEYPPETTGSTDATAIHADLRRADEDKWDRATVETPVVKFLDSHCWLTSLLVSRIHDDWPSHGMSASVTSPGSPAMSVSKTSPAMSTSHASPAMSISHASPAMSTSLTSHASPAMSASMTSHASMSLSQSSDNRLRCLEQLFASRAVLDLATLYEGNAVIGALHVQPEARALWDWLDALAEAGDWSTSLKVLRALPERLLATDKHLQTCHDLVLSQLASLPLHADCEEVDEAPWQYCQLMHDVSRQTACALANLKRWPGPACEQVLLALLDHDAPLAQDARNRLKRKLHKVRVYNQVLSCCGEPLGLASWHEVKTASRENPASVLRQLVEARQAALALTWVELHRVATRVQHLVDTRLVLLLLESDTPHYQAVTQLLQSLLTVQAVSVCKELVPQLSSLPGLAFVADFLLGWCAPSLAAADVLAYRHLSVGAQMLAVLPPGERARHLDLAPRPRLIVEQFLMNTKLDVLERMLTAAGPSLSQLPLGSPVSVPNVDALLRQYAAKALDFRVTEVRPPHAATAATPPAEDRLMASMSSTTGSGSGSAEFVMPATVPTKDQWVPNDEVTECMCCDAVAFSMFNRRHHCRRCGRVVCWACSRHRLRVPGYGDVLVRVCESCSDATQRTANEADQSSVLSVPGSVRSLGPDQWWRLTADRNHNETVRGEFGFEHAPSVSLCLAILKLHSEQAAYPRFLLDSCDRMLQLLQPVRPGQLNREVDHGLVIRMVRALIVAAKVKYARSGLFTGVAHCDQLLSQADLLSELVRRDCLYLIPGEALTGHALRRLRDRLVEEERWEMAMDVSTKGGLERGGVWAAWGKASLRSGRWDEARQKFSHCLEKVSSPSEALRPSRNPPLLTEIVQILETGAYRLDRNSPRPSAAPDASKPAAAAAPTAHTIQHILKSLKAIASGTHPQTASSPPNMVIIGPVLDPHFYKECRYYLATYGSHAGILGFYLGHDDMGAALRHVRGQGVDPAVFYESVYVPCLRRGAVASLHHEMEVDDPTLAAWKTYLCHACRHLEQSGLMHVLYQLQLYMKDYVRAAMTCIRFYRSGARNYAQLAGGLDHLARARQHLEEESALHWQATASGSQRRASTVSGVVGGGSPAPLLPMRLAAREVDRHIATVALQTEATRFLAGCEQAGRATLAIVPEVFQHLAAVGGGGDPVAAVPTLFGGNTERLQLAVLIILCGKNVEEGFGTAFRIISDYHLSACQVYSLAGKKLARDNRLQHIEQLVRCIQTSGGATAADTSATCDEVLTLCVRVRAEAADTGNVEPLVKLMADTGNKISAYIECKQLKSAYLLAVKCDRLGDVRRIYREAERLGQAGIRKICAKRLGLPS